MNPQAIGNLFQSLSMTDMSNIDPWVSLGLRLLSGEYFIRAQPVYVPLPLLPGVPDLECDPTGSVADSRSHQRRYCILARFLYNGTDPKPNHSRIIRLLDAAAERDHKRMKSLWARNSRKPK